MAGRVAEAPPSDNIYVDGLPERIDEVFVTDLFAQYGTVLSCKAMPGKRPGQKGAALVRFESIENAEWVVNSLNGKVPEGLDDSIAVRFANQSKGSSSAKPVVPAGASNGGWGHSQNGGMRSSPYPGGAVAPSGGRHAGDGGDNTYVDGLPPDVNEEMVKDILRIYGNVTSCKAMPAKFDGQKGAALVRWSSIEEAEWVVSNLNGKVPEGLTQEIAVRFAKRNQSGSGNSGAVSDAPVHVPPLHRMPPPHHSVPPPHHSVPPHHSAPSWHEAPVQYSAVLDRPGGHGVSDSDIEEVVNGFYRSGQLPGSFKVEDISLYIVGLPRNTTELELYKIFSTFGALAQKGVTAKYGPDGFCTGVAFVDFLDRGAAENAIATLNNSTMPDGAVLNVRYKKPKRGY